jgi:hypothetical protein
MGIIDGLCIEGNNFLFCPKISDNKFPVSFTEDQKKGMYWLVNSNKVIFNYVKVLLLTASIFCFLAPTFSQAQRDSLDQKISVQIPNLDSLSQSLPQLPDSLLPSLHKVDSIRAAFNGAADSLQSAYQKTISRFDRQVTKLTHSKDSLQQLNLPTGKYSHKLDSLSQLRQNTTTRFTSKLENLKSKTTGKLNSLDLPPEYKGPIQQLTSKMEALNLNSDVVKIPSLNIPGYSLPNIGGIGDVTSKASELVNIPHMGDLPKVETPLGGAGQLAQQAQGYQDDIKNITKGNLNDVQSVPKAIEAQAAKVDGIDELQKQSGVVDGYKGKLDDLNDPDAAKQKAIEMGKQVAVDHFAGKEQQLKAAMEKIAKYKQKYSSVSSLKDLPKRPPNAMKGKPFVERLVPGLYLQYQQKNFYLIDVNPYLGYRISGRFTSGLGWNHRFAYDKKRNIWKERSRIFGPRGYVDFKMGKGFIAHLEGESMDSFVPSTIAGNPDTGHREWVWSLMTGLKKEYRIYRNLKGTALIQYNLFNRFYKAPYVDRLNSRIGFEYVLKKSRRRK